MPTELDNAKPLFGSIHACRRIARAVFLGSAPDAGAVGGLSIIVGSNWSDSSSARPAGPSVGYYKDAVRALVDRLQYINSANNRYWFDTRPNLRARWRIASAVSTCASMCIPSSRKSCDSPAVSSVAYMFHYFRRRARRLVTAARGTAAGGTFVARPRPLRLMLPQ